MELLGNIAAMVQISLTHRYRQDAHSLSQEQTWQRYYACAHGRERKSKNIQKRERERDAIGSIEGHIQIERERERWMERERDR